MRDIPSFSKSPRAQKFEIHGFYRQSYLGGPSRPFVRVAVSLPRFEVARVVEMLVDSGADTTTLAPKDSLLLLEESQFEQLSGSHQVLGIGGLVNFFQEEAALGLVLADGLICWIPILIDIADPSINQATPSILGNDVLRFGEARLDAARETVKITLWLPYPLVTLS